MIDDKYQEITEFMDKCLYQEAAPSMEEAIQQYLVNWPYVVGRLITEIEGILNSGIGEYDLMGYIERHSDYVENNSAVDTFELFKRVLLEG